MAWLYPEDVDQRMGWPLGRAARMARQGKLPHLVLPDGSLWFTWPEIEALVVRVPAAAAHAAAE
jgi:hypothetical protein